MKKYRVYLYNDLEMLVLDSDEISKIDFIEETPKFKKSIRRYGPIKPNKSIEITYDDPYFNMNFTNFEASASQYCFRDIGITIQIISGNLVVEQIDLESNSFSVEKTGEKSLLSIKYESVTSMSGFMMYLHPKYVETSNTYISERKKWIRDRRINYLLS